MSRESTQKYIKNAKAISGNGFSAPTPNTPKQYASRQKQYMAERTKAFTENRAYLASDFVSADIQGLTPDFYAYTTTNVRLSDVSTLNVTALTTKKSDDFKEMLIPDMSIDYIPIGAKVVTMGSTWIVINPSNISSVGTTTIICRCNASYSFYDDYGNIVTEPILVEKASMLGNGNDAPLNMVLMDGYFNVVCQLNENTAKLSENSRIILGKKAYEITGYTDFIQEFSGDLESAHLCTFTIRVDEPTERDDLRNRIADGLSFTFTAACDYPETMQIGATETLSPILCINHIEVQPTEEFPQTWDFASSNSDVLTCDESGTMRAISDGTATVTATLRQNPKISTSADVEVVATQTADFVAFLGATARAITQYGSQSFTAAYFENGTQTSREITFTVSGTNKENYSTSVSGNTITVSCISPSDKPLNITAIYGEYSETVSVELNGY